MSAFILLARRLQNLLGHTVLVSHLSASPQLKTHTKHSSRCTFEARRSRPSPSSLPQWRQWVGRFSVDQSDCSLQQFCNCKAAQCHEQCIANTDVLCVLFHSTGGFLFGYDTGQISDILLMQDFLLRFAECGDINDYHTCRFKTGIEGLVVGLLSIGTLFGALGGGENDKKRCRSCESC